MPAGASTAEPQYFLIPALHEMVGKMVTRHCSHALSGLGAGLRSEIQVLARDVKSLDTTTLRQQGELTRLGGEVAGLRQFAAAQPPKMFKCPRSGT